MRLHHIVVENPSLNRLCDEVGRCVAGLFFRKMYLMELVEAQR